MSRPLRIEFAGALYHVTARGNRREAIYEDDADRRLFLDVLGDVVERFNWLCHAYCLMTNHYHLMVETPDGNLAKGMRQLQAIGVMCGRPLYPIRQDGLLSAIFAIFTPAKALAGRGVLPARRFVLIRLEHGDGIPLPVNHPDDDERGLRDLVVDHVVPVEMRPQAGSKVVAARPKLWMVAQGFKFFLDAPDKRVRRFRRGLGDKGPDFGKIVFGPIGYEEGERPDRFCLPFSIIRSASKFRTRPASISSIPV